jgi:hypothetical protein
LVLEGLVWAVGEEVLMQLVVGEVLMQWAKGLLRLREIAPVVLAALRPCLLVQQFGI